MDDTTRAALGSLLNDVRAFTAIEGGTDKHPDHQHLIEDVERRLAELLGTSTND